MVKQSNNANCVCSCNQEVFHYSLILISIPLQAEYGDWHSRSKDFTPDHYLSPRILRRLGRQFARDSMPARHHRHVGLMDREAELRYVKEMLILPEYGLHFYKVYAVSVTLIFF